MPPAGAVEVMTMTATTATTFCPRCGGAPFCLTTCPASTASERYWQRTAYQARLMLALVHTAEQRAYYSGRLAQAEAALAPALARAA
jgi:hypothetical protein